MGEVIHMNRRCPNCGAPIDKTLGLALWEADFEDPENMDSLIAMLFRCTNCDIDVTSLISNNKGE